MKACKVCRKVTEATETEIIVGLDSFCSNGCLLVEWNALDESLSTIKAQEMIFRKEVEKHFFPNHKKEGTENVPLGNGYNLKGVFKLNVKIVDKDNLEATLNQMLEGGTPAEIVSRLISYEPKLSTKEYKNLLPEAKKVFDTVLEIKESAPSFEIVAPKG